jgi:hypothetical protein
MKRVKAWRATFGVAFVVLLLDGMAAVWLGQVTGRRALLAAGLVLMAAALGVGLMYQRWRKAIDDIETARKDLIDELGALRRAVEDSRAGGFRGD